MATKSELEAAQGAYDSQMALARQALEDKQYCPAIRHAEAAWPFVEDMMNFERRWEKAEFESVPCIDLVLKYAPLTMDAGVLERLGELLRKRKSIDKHASDDLAARLQSAREALQNAHRLWDHLERTPFVRQDNLHAEIGGNKSQWHEFIEAWEKMGLVTRISHGASYTIRLATCMDHDTIGKCSGCGEIVSGKKRAFLSHRTCPMCKRKVDFVLMSTSRRTLAEAG